MDLSNVLDLVKSSVSTLLTKHQILLIPIPVRGPTCELSSILVLMSLLLISTLLRTNKTKMTYVVGAQAKRRSRFEC